MFIHKVNLAQDNVYGAFDVSLLNLPLHPRIYPPPQFRDYVKRLLIPE